MIDFPDQQFQILYCDPPWSYSDKANAGKRGASHKYSVMGVSDLCALPVETIAADDCAMFMWATSPMVPAMLEVGAAWGFKFKTKAFTWIKYTKNASLHWGMGHWTRANSEDCWLFVKGKPKRIDAGVHQVIRSRIRAHSVKPPETRDHIVKLMGDLPRIELFARQQTQGWQAWGNEL